MTEEIKNFYRAFEDRYRGSREVIKKRLEVYLPFILPLKSLYPETVAIDIGCGRGEWIELLKDYGINSIGVDFDTGMLEACYTLSLNVQESNGIEYIKNQPDASASIISAFHVVEHISFDDLHILIKESHRVLKEGGLLILETPNPENIKVSTESFYLDPTHSTPIPSLLLSFATEYYGFSRNKIIRLQEDKELHTLNTINIDQVISGVSPDYAVVAQKRASSEVLSLFDESFNKYYGLSAEKLNIRFENRLALMENHLNKTIVKTNTIEIKTNAMETRASGIAAKANEMEAKANEIIHRYNLIVNSRSWKITKPIRIVANFFRSSLHAKKNFINDLFMHKMKDAKRNNENTYMMRSDPIQRKNQLLIDISHLYREDLKTGIQRVVRSISEELEKIFVIGDFDVQPIFLTDEDNYWCYKYVNNNDVAISVQEGDVFLGLDLNAVIIEANKHGLFENLKSKDIKIVFVVYDILPITNPQWWPKTVGSAHADWLNIVLKYSDQVLCISKTVKNNVDAYLAKNMDNINNNPITSWFHLGADIINNSSTTGISKSSLVFLEKQSKKINFLMVGTIEPRKAHLDVLYAFEELWSLGYDISLFIVGKQGWIVEDTIDRIERHPELNSRLFWFQNASDEYLKMLYFESTCLIAASEDEGFGLPLIEAAQHQLPIIARDIPVFREVAGDYAYYFNNAYESNNLTNTIKNWLKLYTMDTYPKSDNMPWFTWKESALEIIDNLNEKKL